SLGAAAVRTSQGDRIYAVGGYASTSGTATPVNTVEEFNPATNTWRTVASLPTAVAQFGITVAGGNNTADAFQLIHVISGNAGTVLTSVQELQTTQGGAGNVTVVAPPHTDLPAPRARFGVGATLTTNQVYVMGGVDGTGADQTTIFEYTVANNPPAPGIAGPP